MIGRPRDRDDKSLRYLLLKHTADMLWNQYVDSAIKQMQRTGDRLIESNAYYNMAVEDAATNQFFWVSFMNVQKENARVIECTTQHETAIAHYQYLMHLHLSASNNMSSKQAEHA